MHLPDNLWGDKWFFVQLPFSAVQEEVSSLETRYAFGGSLDLDLLGFEFDNKTLVPGLAAASSRAKPLAAWMNGLEVSSVEVDTTRGCLILSVGSIYQVETAVGSEPLFSLLSPLGLGEHSYWRAPPGLSSAEFSIVLGSLSDVSDVSAVAIIISVTTQN